MILTAIIVIVVAVTTTTVIVTEMVIPILCATRTLFAFHCDGLYLCLHVARLIKLISKVY